MEEKREESKEELTRLQEESAQLDGELKQISREKRTDRRSCERV